MLYRMIVISVLQTICDYLDQGFLLLAIAAFEISGPAMPTMSKKTRSFKQREIAYLETVADHKICASCWAHMLEQYLGRPGHNS